MPQLIVPEGYRDLMDVRYAVLATLAPDGKPQLTAVGFIFDQDVERVKISLNDTRHKARNLRRDPRATLFIVDPDNPHRTLEIRGTAELTADQDFTFAATVSAKYGGDVRALDNSGETRSIVTLNPSRIVATHIK